MHLFFLFSLQNNSYGSWEGFHVWKQVHIERSFFSLFRLAFAALGLFGELIAFEENSVINLASSSHIDVFLILNHTTAVT